MGFPVDIVYIDRAEQELGAVFPEDFRLSVMNDNGGVSVEWMGQEWLVMPIRDDSNVTRLKRTWCDIIVETRQMRSWGLPDHFVVFADSGDGNYLMFRISDGRMESQVYVWDHESGIPFGTGVSFGQLKPIE